MEKQNGLSKTRLPNPVEEFTDSLGRKHIITHVEGDPTWGDVVKVEATYFKNGKLLSVVNHRKDA